MVFNQNGIFKRATDAANVYGKEKSREELTLALSDASMRKYTTGLDDDELNEILNEIGSVDGDDPTKVTVDGYNWKINREDLTIEEYLGEDDGIEIRYKITGNDSLITGTPNIQVAVTVKNNKGTLDISSIKVTKTTGGTTSNVTVNSATFTLTVTETTETIFKVSAKNSKGEQSTPRTIKIVPKIDSNKPVISGQTATASGMKITIRGNAVDNEGNLESFTYSVSPATVKDNKATGPLTPGTAIEIETTAVGDYTVTFTAKDKAGNTATATAGPVTTTDAISVSDLKSKITASNYPEYLGRKVNYKPDDTVAWRVFYYDATGEFGDGAGTIYLKRDYSTTTTLSSYTSHVPADGGALMKQLNKEWAKSDNGKKATSNWLANEHCASWLCDSTKWTQYKTSEAKYVIGAAPIEMWCKAQNVYRNKYDTSASLIGCGIKSANGYGYKIGSGSLVDWQNTTVVSNTNTDASKVIATGSYQWLASPSSDYYDLVCSVGSSGVCNDLYRDAIGVCPVVSLNH